MVKMSLFPEMQNRMDPMAFEVAVEELGLTYAVLAERLGVDTKTIGRWAKGETPIPGAVAILLHLALAVLPLSHHYQGPGAALPASRRARSRQASCRSTL